jgi:Flp pilus assembly protein TadD
MNTLLKIAVSSLVLGATLMGNTAGRADVAVSAPSVAKAERQAAKFAAKAGEALKASDVAKAVTLAESAVALDARNADYRALLGQSYLSAGRFASAATALRDALTLNPAHGRAALSLALAEIAYGRNESARNVLAQAREFVPAADYGLALALAGDKEGAITILEAAARGEGATPKTRQNLALAYALSGRWKEAHVTAAQDVPADELPERMTKWAQFARPQAATDQVAALLGVQPTIDPGQPSQLALLPAAPAPVAVAAVVEKPAPVAPVAETPAPEPVVASVEPVAPVAQPLPPVVTAEMAAPKARAAESIFFAAPAAKPTPIMRKVELPASKPAASVMRVAMVRPKPQPRPAKPGNFVVQLGAFSSASRVEAAWSKYSGRTRRLSGYVPVSTTFRSASNAIVHRLSVGGFATRNEAWTLCDQIKANGGACFVRGTAGDAPMQFASRSKPVKLASR